MFGFSLLVFFCPILQSKAQETSVDVCSPCNHDPSDLQAFPEEEEEEEERINASDIPWEERYEKIWVESEKKETKSQYKNVTAELKERFGELEHKELDDDDVEDGNQAKEDEEVDAPEEKEADVEESSEEEDEPIVRPTARARTAVLLPIPEQRESGLEDSQSEEPPDNVQRATSVEISDADPYQDSHQFTSDNKAHSSSSEEDLSAGSTKAKKCPTELEKNVDTKEEGRHRTTLLAASEPDVQPKILDVPSSDSDEVEEGLWRSRYEVGHQSGTSLQ